MNPLRVLLNEGRSLLRWLLDPDLFDVYESADDEV